MKLIVEKKFRMKSYKLIGKFLLLSMLWISGVNVCRAECSTFPLYNADSEFVGPIDLCDSGPGTEYCVFGGVGGSAHEGITDCEDAGGVPWFSVVPLSGASFLLVFLLGIYGIYTYRKRVAV